MRQLRAKPLELLVDAAPEWVRRSNGVIVGLTFDCPLHAECSHIGGPSRIGVTFLNPIGSDVRNPHGWQRTGESFEAISIAPSIRVMDHELCGWHGYVRDGRFETCGDSR